VGWNSFGGRGNHGHSFNSCERVGPWLALVGVTASIWELGNG
jgi:hypothetical protein